jgi:hypothetical protein
MTSINIVNNPSANTPAKTGLVANEPVLVGTLVIWLFSFVGSLVIGHTGLIDQHSWSTLSSVLVPVVSALVLAGIGYVTRKFVSPAWKKIEHTAISLGLTPEQEKHIEEIIVKTAVTEIGKLPKTSSGPASV